MSRARTTRREFLRQTGSIGAACLASELLASPACSERHTDAPPSPRVRLSLADFVKDDRMLASFRKGVKKMRSLPPTDPRSWIFQANIHWRPFFPVYVYEQAKQSSDPAQQLFQDDPGFAPNPNVFNQCPHGNWWFLPWHRAYLYYFERILRWAAEDTNLALPYWNYSDPNQRELPPAYRQPKVGGDDNPLYLPESATFTDGQSQPQVFLMRDGSLLRGETQLTASVTSLKALTVIPFTNAKPSPSNAGFGSPQACDPTCGCGSGALESIPHNRVHTSVGGSSAQSGGALRIGFMGDISTAARDPIFWAHHSNIDRLWASWVALQQGRQNPSDPEWLQYPFVFFDVDSQGTTSPVSIAPESLLTTEQLGYKYDKLEPLPPAMAAAALRSTFQPVSQTLKSLAATPSPKTTETRPHMPMRRPAGIQLTTTQSKTVPMPLERGITPEALRPRLTAGPGERKEELLLSVEGIEFDHMPGVDYEIYLNLPERARPDPNGPYYVGTLTFFGMAHHAGNQGHGTARAPRYAKFALPEDLRKALADKPDALNDLKVTFVPETGTEPVQGRAKVPERADRPAVSIHQVRLLSVR